MKTVNCLLYGRRVDVFRLNYDRADVARVITDAGYAVLAG